MRKSKYSEYQIVKILQVVEGGRTVKDVCREHGISSATYYKWKSKYGGMEASDIQRMKDLESENRQLKQLFADLSIENTMLKDVIEEKSCKAGSEKGVRGVRYCQACNEHPQSLRGAGHQSKLLRYRPRPRDDSEVIAALTELADKESTWGFSKLFDAIRQQGRSWNHKPSGESTAS